MADLFTSLVAISPLVGQVKGKGESRIPGLSPTVKAGITNGRGNAVGGKTPPQGHVLDASTVALWRYDEASGALVNDIAPGARHLTLNGTHTVVAGQIGNARQFLNVAGNSADRAGDATLVSLFINGGYTFESWINVTISGIIGAASIFSHSGTFGGGEPNNSRAGLFVAADGSLLTEWQAPATTYTSTNPSAIPTGLWTHAAIRVADVGGSLRVVSYFINGLPVANIYPAVAMPQVGTAASCRFRVGQAFDEVIGYHFPGIIDDSRLSNVLRSDAEILASYVRGVGQL